jgi:hypothetical protein
LSLLQAKKYTQCTHSTGTVTIPRAMKEDRKKDGNDFPPPIIN